MEGEPRDPLDDAELAARLFLVAPTLFGGMVLRGASPARDALVSALSDAMTLQGRCVRRLPGHVDDERLLGGIDIAASLASGRAVEQRGLLDECAGGAVIVPMAERLEPSVAGRLAQRADEGADGPAMILLDDGREADDAPPASLLERAAFHADLAASREWRSGPLDVSNALALERVAPLVSEALEALAATAEAFGVASLRPLIFAAHAARASAALAGRSEVEEGDLAAAARLVLAPRATQLPPLEEQPPPPEEAPPDTPPEEGMDERDTQQPDPDAPLEEILVEAAKAAIPADLLAALAQGKAARRVAGGGTGKRRKSGLRGKPLGARQGLPRGGARLALIDTLRAAVPWQEVRRRETGASGEDLIQMRKEDLRVRRFEDKAARVTIFAVDASGSAAAARLAEAKGAVELMLAQAYVTRSEVALVAFRGESAELVLPPTRSLTRARRALSELPGGGGTPLAMGLDSAHECAEAVASKGRTPSLVILTDGRANIDRDGRPGRKQAGEDAETSAKAIARAGIDALVIDISARAAREGAALAEAMNARFLALPRADARQIADAVDAMQPPRAAA
ncbi:MAG: magnesium chelatase subunit D [Erythrobacter sp.]|uniref:magnesium chelatase subunit D n=1 Tax=Erythrobacter sp. TaxID=1042 RepID=UPI002627D470|nr:magnesium chelatase subunit D [Erythrobacter sp.]MDJ0978586.1 magnesium chelatase subunit D [Erythrobacter sp.]